MLLRGDDPFSEKFFSGRFQGLNSLRESDLDKKTI
jgi:hypothetical protein